MENCDAQIESKIKYHEPEKLLICGRTPGSVGGKFPLSEIHIYAKIASSSDL